MQGTVLKVLVEAGQAVEAGQVVCIVEAMKMENEVASPRAGTIRAIRVSEGGSVNAGEVVAELD